MRLVHSLRIEGGLGLVGARRHGDQHDTAAALDVGLLAEELVDPVGEDMHVQNRRLAPKVGLRQDLHDRGRVLIDDASTDLGRRRSVGEAELHDLDGNDNGAVGLHVTCGKQSCLPSGFRRLYHTKNHRGVTVI